MILSAGRRLRSVRRRPAAFIAVLVLSAGSVLVSVMTPMLIDALDAATLRESVATAPMPRNGVAASAVAQSADGVQDAESAVSYLLLSVTATSDRWSEPVSVLQPDLVAQLRGPGRRVPLQSQFSIEEDGCSGLHYTGRCPDSVREALLPRSIARSTGWTTGTELSTPLPLGDPLQIDVVGVFDDTVGRGRVMADPTQLVQTAASRAVSNVVIGQQGASTLQAPFEVAGSVRLVRPVRPGDVPIIRGAVSRAQRGALDGASAAVSATVTTELPALLADVARQQSAAAVLSAPVGIEAVVLAWLALAAVAQRMARARAAEWGLGRMRGARPSAWAATVFAEPLAAIVIGALLGLGAGIGIAAVAAMAVFGSGVDVGALLSVGLPASGVAVAGSVVALALSSIGAALAPLPDLLQDSTEPRRLSRASTAGYAAVVSLAVVVTWTALASSQLAGNQPGLLLPAAVAVVVGLAAVRIAVLVVRRLSDRPPRSLTGLIVGRGLARAPSALVAGRLVLFSAALVAFAAQLVLVSATVQTDRAVLLTGAARVLSVHAPAGTSLVQAVRRADPGGRVAMAAADLATSADAGGARVTAVDTTRVAAVSAWRTDLRTGIDLARLRPSAGRDLVVRGTRLSVSIAGVTVTDADFAGPQDARMELQVELATPDGWTTTSLGALRAGTSTATVPCRSGCRLIAFGIQNGDPGKYPWGVVFRLTAIATDRQPASAFTSWLSPGRWRDRVIEDTDPARPARVTASAPSGAFTVTASDRSGQYTALLEPANGPEAVPAVAGSAAPLLPFAGVRGAVQGSSLDDTPLLLAPIGRAVALPRSLRVGVLVDLETIERQADPTRPVADQQVWLTAGPHTAVIAALRREGVRILGEQDASTAVASGLRSATHRALLVAAVTALIALLFGLLALVATRLIDLPERRREWGVLRLAGAEDRALRRLAVVQIAAPTCVGAVVGVVSGSAVATVLAGRLPLLVGQSAGPPLDPLPAPLVLVAVLAGILALLGVTTLVLATVERRRAR